MLGVTPRDSTYVGSRLGGVWLKRQGTSTPVLGPSTERTSVRFTTTLGSKRVVHDRAHPRVEILSSPPQTRSGLSGDGGTDSVAFPSPTSPQATVPSARETSVDISVTPPVVPVGVTVRTGSDPVTDATSGTDEPTERQIEGQIEGERTDEPTERQIEGQFEGQIEGENTTVIRSDRVTSTGTRIVPIVDRDTRNAYVIPSRRQAALSESEPQRSSWLLHPTSLPPQPEMLPSSSSSSSSLPVPSKGANRDRSPPRPPVLYLPPTERTKWTVSSMSRQEALLAQLAQHSRQCMLERKLCEDERTATRAFVADQKTRLDSAYRVYRGAPSDSLPTGAMLELTLAFQKRVTLPAFRGALDLYCNELRRPPSDWLERVARRGRDTEVRYAAAVRKLEALSFALGALWGVCEWYP